MIKNSLSFPAKAGNPVRRGLSVSHSPLWNTGSPGQAGGRQRNVDRQLASNYDCGYRARTGAVTRFIASASWSSSQWILRVADMASTTRAETPILVM